MSLFKDDWLIIIVEVQNNAKIIVYGFLKRFVILLN